MYKRPILTVPLVLGVRFRATTAEDVVMKMGFSKGSWID